MKNKIIIACSKKWFYENAQVKKFLKKKNIIIIKNKKEFNKKNIEKINPDYIFFPHWSHKVNKIILNKFKCICFHTAPLPYGRGGSPIQNLIKRNFKKSPVCALRMTDKIDSGPIFIKKNISLEGSLENIFDKLSSIIIKMIDTLIKKKISPIEQKGKVVFFNRIKKNESEIKNEKNILAIYNKIRMLDSKEYPKAFIKVKKYKLYFFKAKFKKNSVLCNAKIVKIKK